MRKIVIAAALGALAAMPSAAPAQTKDSVVIGMRLEPPGLDPTTGAAAAISQVTLYNVFETLTRLDASGVVRPLLARSWTISEDGLTYRFDLLEGVAFHDSTTFTAADVVFSFERNKAEDSTNKLKQSVFDHMLAIEAPDPSTVVVRLDAPNSLLPFKLALAASVIVGPETADSNATEPVGTGPYRFVKWTKGDSVDLEKFADYRNAGNVRIANVRFRFIGDAAAQAAALLSGGLDYMPNLGAPEMFGEFEANPDFVAIEGTTEGETILAMNNKNVALSDVRVRRAIIYAIDRQALIEGAQFGYGTPIGTHFAPHHPAYVELSGVYPYNPAKARTLLRQAGYEGGLELRLALPPPTYARRGGEIIAAMLADVGITAKIENVEWAQWLDKVFGKKLYDLTIISHVEPMDLDIYANPDYYFQYDDPGFRDIVAAITAAVTVDEQTKFLQRAQRKLTEDAVNGFLFELPKLGVMRNGLGGTWKNWPAFINDVSAMYWED